MRLARVVARAALIAAFALVVVPGAAGSRIPSTAGSIDARAFSPVDLELARTAMTTLDLDPAGRSNGHLDPDAPFGEPAGAATLADPARPLDGAIPTAPVIVQAWTYDPQISWYGPGLYGNRTACGKVVLQPGTIGVAHRTLKCGTKVAFMWHGRTVVAEVIDRGPYVRGRIFDLTKGACMAIKHCFTGPIYYRIL